MRRRWPPETLAPCSPTLGGQAVGQRREPRTEADARESALELRSRGAGPGQREVLRDGAGEQVGVLGTEADGGAQVVLGRIADRDAPQR